MFCFTSLLLSEQFQSDSADIVMNFSIFILIVAIFFVSYHTFLFYIKNRLEKKEEKSKHVVKDDTHQS